MIRVRLINEGKVVKQITSRLHEGVVMAQIEKYQDPFDTIQIVEGDLSEGAKDMLHHVAKKIIPAAMAAGVALGGASGAQAQGGANPNYPGLNYSVGDHVRDIVSPNYRERVRQREHQRSTERQVWDAEQNEIRRQRVQAARDAARAHSEQNKVYDQARNSGDGKFIIIYGMDDRVTRIPAKGTEFMPADSQRMAHYITPNGKVYYVRHPHTAGIATSIPRESVAEGAFDNASPMFKDSVKKDRIASLKNLIAIAKEKGNTDKVKELKRELNSLMNEGYTVTRGIDRERYQERPGLEGPFSTKSGKVVYYDKREGKYYDPDTDMYIEYDDWRAMNEGGTVGTIPASGTSSAPSSNMQKKTQFSPTGQTTDVQVNDKGELELADPNAIDPMTKQKMAQAGLKIAEAAQDNDSPVVRAVTARILHSRLDLLQKYGPEKIMAAIDDVAEWVGDVDEIGTSDVSAWVKDVERSLGEMQESATEVAEDGRTIAKLAGGLGLGAVAAAGAPAIVGILGPLLGIPMAAYGAYSAAKLGMQGVEKLWDMAAEKLGGDDKVAQYTNAKIAKLPPEQKQAAIATVKQLGESRKNQENQDVTEGANELDGILDRYSEDWAKFKAGGDIDENVDFYHALYDYWSSTGEMPYGTMKGRDGDPVEWITQRMDQEAGNHEVAESQLNEYLLMKGEPITSVRGLNLFTDLDDVDGLSAHYEDFANNPAWQQVEKKYAPIAAKLIQRLHANDRVLTAAEATALEDTWYDGSDAYDDVEVEYLVNVYDNQIDKIEALLAGNLTDEEFGESIDDEEASAADQAAADKNIIMQIRRAADYEKATDIQLGDGSTGKINSRIAKELLSKFDRMRPDSKAELQRVLNTQQGFIEIVKHFGGIQGEAVTRVGKIMAQAMQESGWM